MSDRCIANRYWRIDEPNKTMLDQEPFFKGKGGTGLHPVIVIRESDIKKKFTEIRAVLSELPESPENVRLHVMMRSEVSTLLSLLPPKEREAME